MDWVINEKDKHTIIMVSSKLQCVGHGHHDHLSAFFALERATVQDRGVATNTWTVSRMVWPIGSMHASMQNMIVISECQSTRISTGCNLSRMHRGISVGTQKYTCCILVVGMRWVNEVESVSSGVWPLCPELISVWIFYVLYVQRTVSYYM